MDIKKAKTLYNRLLAKQKKYANTSFCFEVAFNKMNFTIWMTEQFNKQDGKCHYCGVSQQDINRLIEAKVITSKRFNTRGKTLELERLDSRSNNYSPENCVLICYFCNNDKSDVVSSEDYVKFFAGPKRKYIEHLFKKLTNS